MQKKWILIISILLLWTGCGVKEKELQLEKLNIKLQEINLDTLDYASLDTILKDVNSYNIYTKEELKEKLSLEETLYENIFFCEAKETVQKIIVIEFKKEKKQEIEDIMKNYFEQSIQNATTEEEKKQYETRLEQEYGNHLIYIVGNNSATILEQIKETKKKIFSNMIELEKEEVEKKLDISSDMIEEYLFGISDKLNNATQYLIIKTKDSTNVRQKIHNYFEELEQEWKTKNSKQYELLKNRMEKQLGNYLIYIVSSENKMAFKMIESYYK